jgi:hypothetical protein
VVLGGGRQLHAALEVRADRVRLVGRLRKHRAEAATARTRSAAPAHSGRATHPVVMPPPRALVHAVSVLPLSGPIVAPTAVTCGAVAGKDGWKPAARKRENREQPSRRHIPHLVLSSRAPKLATPSSPLATNTLMPRRPSLAIYTDPL